MKKPLEGIRMLDLTHMLSGPYGAMIISDLGADTVKVEPPKTGEGTRRLLEKDPNNSIDGMGAYFFTLNRNKRSVTLDLKSEEGLEQFYELVKAADVVMNNFSAGVTKKLKIDYDSFIIIQTVVAQKLYYLKKKDKSKSYEELESLWEKMLYKHDNPIGILSDNANAVKITNKLTISSICLVTGLPKETVRRKTNELVKRNLLKSSKIEGVLLGPTYKKIFQNFVPETTLEVAKLLKNWEKIGILKNLLNFKT